MDTLQSLNIAVLGVGMCGIGWLISAVTAQELGRIFLHRRVAKWASGLAGGVGGLLALTLAFLCFEAWFPAR